MFSTVSTLLRRLPCVFSSRFLCLLLYVATETRARARKHVIEDKFKPDKPGHKFENNYILSARVEHYIRQELRDITPEVIDYNLAVAFFLEETAHLRLPGIPQSVDRILEDFDLLRPLTSRQHDLWTCATHIKSTIDIHHSKPRTSLPFALRYPNITALKDLTAERSKCPKALPSGKAVVLVDLAGCLLVISLPRKGQQASSVPNQKDPTPEVC